MVTLVLNDVTYSEPGSRLEVRLVQPDLPVAMSYTQSTAVKRIDRAVAMSSRSAMGKQLDLIVWPESTIATPLRNGLDVPALAAVDVAAKTGASVVFNAFYREGPGRYYNGMWMAADKTSPRSSSIASIISCHSENSCPPDFDGLWMHWAFRWPISSKGLLEASRLKFPV